MVKNMKEEMEVIEKENKILLERERQYLSAQRHEVYRLYEKDSFDRFGDDLSELLLTYLDFEDKVRFECVSKQWQRLVFNKVIDISHILFCLKNPIEELKKNVENQKLTNPRLIINPKSVTFHQMKTVLKKCHNLKTIKFYLNSETIKSLALLSDNCHRLKSIKLFIDFMATSESMTKFFRTLGSKVEDISIHQISGYIQLLKWCPNLKRLQCHDWESLVGNELVPTLECLDSVYVHWEEMPAFVQLVDKYKNTMKFINTDKYVIQYTIFHQDMEFYIQQLCRFKKLESLEFCSQYLDTLDLSLLFINSMENCTNLSKINFYSYTLAISKPWKSLVGIKNLDFTYRVVSEDFFTNLPDLMPNLRKLYIHTEKQGFKNQDLIDISRLKNIQELRLYSNKHSVYPIIHSTDDSGVIQLLDNCMKLKELVLKFSSNITEKTIDKLKEVAIKRPKERISFFAIIPSGDQSEAFRQSLTRIHDNLAINLRETER